MTARSVVLTADGSASIFVPELQEHYHSVHGAASESIHVFINAGLKPKMEEKQPLNVLEAGLGTGLNAALTWTQADQAELQIIYHAFEPYPLRRNLVRQLVSAYRSDENLQKRLIGILNAPFGVEQKLSPSYSLMCHQMCLQNATLEPEMYDLVFFDAFSPGTQPDMWTKDVFEQLYCSMKPGAFLCTYVAQGEVRRTMKACGFMVEKLPGFAGKREMTRAIK